MSAPAPAGPELLARLAALEDRRAIEDVMQVYAEAADAKFGPDRRKLGPEAVRAAARAQAACFTPDAVWRGGGFGGDLAGREALAAFFETSPWRFTSDLYAALRLRLRGDRAEAR